MEAVPLQWEAL